MFIVSAGNTQIRIIQVELNKECIYRSVGKSWENHKGEYSIHCMETAGGFAALGLKEQSSALPELNSERLHGDGLSSEIWDL